MWMHFPFVSVNCVSATEQGLIVVRVFLTNPGKVRMSGAE